MEDIEVISIQKISRSTTAEPVFVVVLAFPSIQIKKN